MCFLSCKHSLKKSKALETKLNEVGRSQAAPKFIFFSPFPYCVGDLGKVSFFSINEAEWAPKGIPCKKDRGVCRSF